MKGYLIADNELEFNKRFFALLHIGCGMMMMMWQNCFELKFDMIALSRNLLPSHTHTKHDLQSQINECCFFPPAATSLPPYIISLILRWKVGSTNIFSWNVNQFHRQAKPLNTRMHIALALAKNKNSP
ncbi:CLUMA_CG010094, isoform A [Clunio marinus]|uniref:CLUMA_CG010094, isoform A n=1 Tax=Clunio marinus TaxID=568069 RepID=A0A1J1IB60_9DIPT|nr:CLUMA_CG010094, isoform A [Clunio marinus]